MHLVVDVGNTESVIGLFRPDSLEIQAHWRYSTRTSRTPDELLLLFRSFLREEGVRPEALARIMVGSVVPVQTDPLRRSLGTLARDGHVVVLEGADGLPIQLDVDDPTTVGADRIANTLAAAHLYREDAIVVDLGTATTFDCIGADGTFYGGVIAPGLQAGQEWLGGRTAKLPRVELAPPERVIGRRTEACLQSGLFYSAVDAIDGLVVRIREEWERPGAKVIATGGHARSLAGHSRTIECVDPYLTLVGLELAGRLREGD
jgi:type III pantothenate kinase